MRYILFFFIALCVLALVSGIGYGYYRTVLSERSPKQAVFAQGTIPSPAPDGLLRGSVEGLQVAWKGKKIDAKHHAGINVFAGEHGDEERYPFIIYPAKGLGDPDLDVLRIDYDLPGNPFWLRRITDELVQVENGTYLGKVHIRILPGYPFTMGYFQLEQYSRAVSASRASRG